MSNEEWDLITERMTKIINFSKTNIVKIDYITIINIVLGNNYIWFVSEPDKDYVACRLHIVKSESFSEAQEKLNSLEFYSLVKIEERLIK